MAKLNGIEVPTKGRIVWVRSSAFGPEYPAIVIDGVDLAPCLFVFAKEMGLSGPSLSILHESMNPAPGMWRWRWPPREEQPAEPNNLICVCGKCSDHDTPTCSLTDVMAAAEARKQSELRQVNVEPKTSLDLREGVIEALKQQLAAETRRATTLVEERDALRLRLAEVERERDDARRVAKRLAEIVDDVARERGYGSLSHEACVALDAALAYEVEP